MEKAGGYEPKDWEFESLTGYYQEKEKNSVSRCIFLDVTGYWVFKQKVVVEGVNLQWNFYQKIKFLAA